MMEDKIVFIQSSNAEELYGLETDNPISRIAWKIFIGLFIVTIGLSFVIGDRFDMSPIFLLYIVYVILMWLLNYNQSDTQVIPRDSLLKVKYKTNKLGESFGYFVFRFKDEHGNKNKRYIVMKSFESGCGEALNKAKAILMQQGLLKS